MKDYIRSTDSAYEHRSARTVTTITTDDVRKAWKQYRGRANWHVLAGRFRMEIPSDVGNYSPYSLNDIPAMEATTTRVTIAADECRWHCADGETYEWWNIIYDGCIIDMEWYRP